VKKEKNKEKISDIELSLITVISRLENKLEELDHNITLLSKENLNNFKNDNGNKEINQKIIILEEKISEISDKLKNKINLPTNINYLNTTTPKRGYLKSKKGYAAADALRLKRIDNLENSLNILAKRFEEKFSSEISNKNNLHEDSIESMKEDYTISEKHIYNRSRGMFFGFLFLIIIIFLLIIVSTDTNLFYIFDIYK
jgi:hypothetical protein